MGKHATEPSGKLLAGRITNKQQDGFSGGFLIAHFYPAE